ncbi:MAG: SDR family oxidoreductase [Gemmatimonadetes bacterium]|nr:SDR family oxidoreductase [Gemmatimonadota bacterium]
MTRSRVLVTGATGFVGSAVIARAVADPSLGVVGTSRTPTPEGSQLVSTFACDLDDESGWTPALDGVDVVVHTAARVHVMADSARDPLREFRRVNVDGTLRLAKAAVAAGTRRFIFVSSIKVNGEQTLPGDVFTADLVPHPLDPYGVSKLEAEDGLRRLAVESGLEVVVIRPVLVYGPGVKANFLQMMRWISRGVPLPLGGIENRRSLVGVDNLVDLILTCVSHPRAANQTFLVSDGEDLSTPSLVRRVAQAMGKPANLIPVPASVLRAVGRALGRGDFVQRLCGSLQVDISKTRELLGWTPPVGMDEGLRATAKIFLDRSAN